MNPRAAAPLLLVASVAACGGSAGPAPTLRIVHSTPVVTLDPHRHNDIPTFSVLSHVYEALVTYDAGLTVVPQLASGWSQEGRRTRLLLRAGVRFHDGRPFTAADAVASLERGRTIDEAEAEPFLKDVVAIRAVDASTVEIETRGPAPLLMHELVYLSMLPRDVPRATTADRVAGTGPYRWGRGAAGGPIEFERFDGYWGQLPSFGRVVLRVLAADDERVASLRSGQADVVVPWPEPAWAAGAPPGARLVLGDSPSVTFLEFGLTAPGSPFADRRLREAVALAVDRPGLVRAATSGLAQPVEQLVPRGVFGHVPSAAPLMHDPAAARALLAAAGRAQGLEVRLVAPETARRVAEALAEQLAAADIRLQLEVQPWPQFRTHTRASGLALSLRTMSSGTGDAADLFDGLLHTPQPPHGSANGSGYSNPELDAILAELAETVDARRRHRLLERAMLRVRADLPLLPLLARRRLYGLRRDLDWRPRLDGRVLAAEMRPAPQAGQ